MILIFDPNNFNFYLFLFYTFYIYKIFQYNLSTQNILAGENNDAYRKYFLENISLSLSLIFRRLFFFLIILIFKQSNLNLGFFILFYNIGL